MLIEDGWKPGVWIDGSPSSDSASSDAFGTFAHRVHEDLLAARVAGRVPEYVEITVSASTIRPLWGDEPPVWLLHIRFTALAGPHDATGRDEVAAEALATLERHGRAHLPLGKFDRYAGQLFFVDAQGRPRYGRTHALHPPPEVASTR
ncbi:hypothetical protein AB0F52_39180 [Amycolatopsis sp. NPDC024027]|uniref:hypothetical protein n=1 Tax=Amycolatopsis sp. NPDC024027 TaxID=3154327 RepID=UPI0033E6F2C8